MLYRGEATVDLPEEVGTLCQAGVRDRQSGDPGEQRYSLRGKLDRLQSETRLKGERDNPPSHLMRREMLGQIEAAIRVQH